MQTGASARPSQLACTFGFTMSVKQLTPPVAPYHSGRHFFGCFRLVDYCLERRVYTGFCLWLRADCMERGPMPRIRVVVVVVVVVVVAS